MAGVVVEAAREERLKSGARARPFSGPAVVTALSAVALGVNGYHPWAEDGGLYAAGIKRLLVPRLYPQETAFVTEHLRFSLFAPLVAMMTRVTHLPLDWMLLLLHCGSIWLTLFAAWMLASRCFGSYRARCGAVALLACWLTLPLAGTSLMLMDPYLTARSVSTPLTMLALCWTLDALDARTDRKRALVLCGGAFLLAGLVHPLMAGYGLVSVLVLVCVSGETRRARVWGCAALCSAGLVVALAVQLHGAAESKDYLRVIATRAYWFPTHWEWYEQVGLVAPLAVIAAMLRYWNRVAQIPAYTRMARMALALALTSIIVAGFFSRASLATHAVARLQPLRTYQTVYVVMIILLGGALAEYWLRDRAWRWAALLLVAGAPMCFAQRNVFPASKHLEMPWLQASNPWVQAFLWIRESTPVNAVFAMAPDYITRPGEDAQCFRAIAERSSLPDYSKDGGETSITPDLTSEWVAGQTAQAGIDEESDAERLAKLEPRDVDWMLLPAGAKTGFACPYANGVVKVCRLR